MKPKRKARKSVASREGTDGTISVCVFCLVSGLFVSAGLLAFGGIVGGLSYFGFAAPSTFWRAASAYMMAAALLYFLVSATIMQISKSYRT